MTNLRVAIIGLGMMGTNHARVLSNLEGVELVAVADPQGDTQRVLPNFKALRSVDEVIKLGVDYCVISAPTAFHEEIASQHRGTAKNRQRRSLHAPLGAVGNFGCS